MTSEKKPRNKGGRPRSRLALGEIVFKGAPKRLKVKMKERGSVEDFCHKGIEELQQDYKRQKSDIEVILDALRSLIEKQSKESGVVDQATLKMFEQQQQRYRLLCNDQASMLSMLMKQFELFSELDRTPDDDPKFTPVSVVIGAAPVDQIEPNKFELEAGDIEPDRRQVD